jgi:hypothetical protein
MASPRRAAFSLIALLVLYLGAIAFVLIPHAQKDTPGQTSERVGALEARESGLSDRVKDIEAEHLDARLAVLEAKIGLVASLLYTVLGGVGIEIILHAMRLRKLASVENRREQDGA